MFEELIEYTDLERFKNILPPYVKMSYDFEKLHFFRYGGKITAALTAAEYDNIYTIIKSEFGERVMEFYTVHAGNCFDVFLYK